MSTSTDTYQCHHCNVVLPEAELAEGWCGGCGKKLPSTFKAAVRGPQKLVAPPPETNNHLGVGLLAAGTLILSVAVAFTVIIFTV